MIVWRTTNYVSLDGRGGLKAPGRWHTRGQRIVYCAPNRTTALLEVLVHTEIDAGDMPLRYRYLEIEVPDEIASAMPTVEDLPEGWRGDTHASRGVGDNWLRSGSTPVLRVPCVIVPMTWNVLVNPVHSDSQKIRIVRVHDHVMDPRLM